MFAYCGNNPISRRDLDGERWEYVIENTETEILEEKESGTTYQTTIVFSGVKTNLFGIEKDRQKSTTATFVYFISNDGAIAFDNTQDDAAYIEKSLVRETLAEEIYITCTNSVTDSLSKRTVKGISSELFWHYKLSFSKPGRIANIGGREKGKPGRDTNAWLFELFK